MKQSDLDAILKKAQLPKTPAESIGSFPNRVLFSIQCAQNLRSRPPQGRHLLVWSVALIVGALIVSTIIHQLGRSASTVSSDSLINPRLIRETLAMFPHRVRAIVQDDHGLNLLLSENDDVPTSSPLYVRICDGKHCSSFLTFSGQQLTVSGQAITVLSDARGGIILTGDRFVWSDQERTKIGNHWDIVTRNLEPRRL